MKVSYYYYLTLIDFNNLNNFFYGKQLLEKTIIHFFFNFSLTLNLKTMNLTRLGGRLQYKNQEKKNYLMKNDSYSWGYIIKKQKIHFIQFNFFHKPEIANLDMTSRHFYWVWKKYFEISERALDERKSWKFLCRVPQGQHLRNNK
jgi:c-di-GMP-related signal transduction protein